MFLAWAVVHNAHFVPIFFSAGGVNASAGVLLILVCQVLLWLVAIEGFQKFG